MSERSVQALIQTLARGAKLMRIPISPHTLRHTFALGYLQQNPGKLVEPAHLLGHESLDTTAIYMQRAAEDRPGWMGEHGKATSRIWKST